MEVYSETLTPDLKDTELKQRKTRLSFRKALAGAKLILLPVYLFLVMTVLYIVSKMENIFKINTGNSSYF